MLIMLIWWARTQISLKEYRGSVRG